MTRRSLLAILPLIVLVSILLFVGGGQVHAAQPQPGEWLPPVPMQGEVRGFDRPETRWSAGHRGVDLPTRIGSTVTSAADGVVVFAGWVAGRPVVSVEHGTIRTTYEPVMPSVQRGARVSRGDPLGTLGPQPGHCRPVACLHWGVKRGADYLDPLSLLRSQPRLLPLFTDLRTAARGIDSSPPWPPALDPAGATSASVPSSGIAAVVPPSPERHLPTTMTLAISAGAAMAAASRRPRLRRHRRAAPV